MANPIDFNIKQLTIMLACMHIMDVIIFQNIIAGIYLLLRRVCILCLLSQIRGRVNAWRTLANFCCKSDDLPTYAQKLSMYTPALRLAKTVFFYCPDEHNKRLANSKIESAGLLLPMYARTQRLL